MRSQQLQHGNPVRREGARSQIVLQIKCADKLRLLDDWQAEDGPGALLPHIFVLGIHAVGRGIIEEHALLCPDHVMQRGLGQIRRRDGCLANGNLDLARAGGGLRFDPRLAVPNQDQQTPLCPAFSTAIRTSFSISAGRAISLEIACDALTTVSTSNCPTGGPIVAEEAGVRSSRRRG